MGGYKEKSYMSYLAPDYCARGHNDLLLCCVTWTPTLPCDTCPGYRINIVTVVFVIVGGVAIIGVNVGI